MGWAESKRKGRKKQWVFFFNPSNAKTYFLILRKGHGYFWILPKNLPGQLQLTRCSPIYGLLPLNSISIWLVSVFFLKCIWSILWLKQGLCLSSDVPFVKIGRKSRVVAGASLNCRRGFSGIFTVCRSYSGWSGRFIAWTGSRGGIWPLRFMNLKLTCIYYNEYNSNWHCASKNKSTVRARPPSDPLKILLIWGFCF